MTFKLSILKTTSCMPIIIFASQLLFTSNSYSLDLKIDLPPQHGFQPTIYYTPAKIALEKKFDDLKKADEISEDPILKTAAIPQSKQIIEYATELPSTPRYLIKNKKQIIDEFPELPCISDNIVFWERVYSDIDKNEGFLHDKDNLGRIYTIVSLPTKSKEQKKHVSDLKEKYGRILESLATKINSPKTWTKQEKAVASLFSKKELTHKDLLLAKNNLRLQSGLKSQFEEGIQRSINYIPIIYPIIKNSGLPMDLIYLPHVESSYNSKAGSKVGALGLWQIMPSTARSLAGKSAMNKRHDPFLSTQIALRLLKENYGKTQNWPLAVTSYNHGVNGVLRAIEETGSRDLCKIIDNYSSPSFKFASTNFYAQFIAAKKIAQTRYAELSKQKHNTALKSILVSSNGGVFK